MNKYVINGGLAFSEEADMKKLKSYAKKGWILEGFHLGLWYKLRKEHPQDIEYTLDYQLGADQEYFNMFTEAGWKHVVSSGDEIHVFSAPEGSKPIYTDKESTIDKYERTRTLFGFRSLYSSVALVMTITANALIDIRPFSIITLVLMIGALAFFVSTFMPYIAYVYRVRKLRA